MAQKKRVVEYDQTDQPSTATHLSVDQKIDLDLRTPAQASMREGFAASSGIRPEVAETGGRVKNPQMKDDMADDRVPDSIEKQNAGLADS